MSVTLTFTVMLMSGCLTAWAAGRREHHIAVIINADLPPRRQMLALLRALTDDEYAQYELGLPVAEQQRRIAVTLPWRHLPRRQAGIAYLNTLTDEQYVATVPVDELAARRVRWGVPAQGVRPAVLA